MSIFEEYADYYDLLYQDKNYSVEAAYLDKLLKANSSSSKALLNLGSGTGRHDFELCRLGYQIIGVERSKKMLAKALHERDRLGFLDKDLSFQEGDIRSVKLTNSFDAVLSLFHVIDYLISTEDIISTFKVAADHLGDQGLFVFDFWYGPAVLSDPPEEREKRVENEDFELVRVGRPEMLSRKNSVDVTYNLHVKNKRDGSIKELTETHRMRYLFEPELEKCLRLSGFNEVRFEEWGTGKEPDLSTWSVTCIAKK